MTEVTQPGLIETLGLNAGLFLAQLVNFALVLLIVSKWIFKPLLGVMDARNQKINQGLDDAEAAKQQLAKAGEKAKAVMSEAKKERQTLLETTKKEAEEERKRIEAETAQSLEKQLEEARGRLKSDKEAMMRTMKKELSSMVVTATEKVGLAAATDAEVQQRLIEQSIGELEEAV